MAERIRMNSTLFSHQRAPLSFPRSTVRIWMSPSTAPPPRRQNNGAAQSKQRNRRRLGNDYAFTKPHIDGGIGHSVENKTAARIRSSISARDLNQQKRVGGLSSNHIALARYEADGAAKSERRWIRRPGADVVPGGLARAEQRAVDCV